MRLQMIAPLVLVITAALVAVPERVSTQPDCVTVHFTTDPEETCGTDLHVNDAIEVSSSPTTISVNGCSTTLTGAYTGVQFFYAGCTDNSVDATCTIFTDGVLSGRYVIIDETPCYVVCAPCP